MSEVMTDTSLQLRGGPVVRPIITNENVAAIRQRQMAFTPEF